MRKILLNKKCLDIIALLFLVIFFSSCSAAGYWWGRPEEYISDFESPWCAMVSIEGPFEVFNFTIWLISLIGLIFYFFGTADDAYGGSHWITINGKTHHVINHDEVKTISGTGSSERGERWGDNILAFILYAIIFYFLYTTITGWFGGGNALIAIIMGIIYISCLTVVHSRIRPIINTIKYIAWFYTAVDFVLGTLVLLWNLTF